MVWMEGYVPGVEFKIIFKAVSSLVKKILHDNRTKSLMVRKKRMELKVTTHQEIKVCFGRYVARIKHQNAQYKQNKHQKKEKKVCCVQG